MLLSGSTTKTAPSKNVVSEKLNKSLRERRSILYLSDTTGSSIVFDSADWYYDFNIKKDNKEQPNTSEINIYGVSQKTIKKIEDNSVYAVLYAGYGDSLQIILSGVISDVFASKSGVDSVVTISSQEGANSYRTAFINKSYKAGTSVKEILNDLISQYGCSGTDIKDVPEDLKFQNGRTLTGLVNKHLREICNYANLEYSVQGDVLQVHAKNGYNGKDCYLVDVETGLIGSPQRKRKKKRKAKTDVDAESSDSAFMVNLETLLNPNFIPSTILKVKSKYLDDYYVIREVTFSGSASVLSNSAGFTCSIVAENIRDIDNTDTITKTVTVANNTKPPIPKNKPEQVKTTHINTDTSKYNTASKIF